MLVLYAFQRVKQVKKRQRVTRTGFSEKAKKFKTMKNRRNCVFFILLVLNCVANACAYYPANFGFQFTKIIIYIFLPGRRR
jgi:hypothetical protein